MPDSAVAHARVIAVDELGTLIEHQRSDGYRGVGPTVRDGVIGPGDIATAGDLPSGRTDEQARGAYRVRRGDDDALFGYADQHALGSGLVQGACW